MTTWKSDILRIWITVLVWPTVVFGAAGRPNVLWITSEDNSPFLGCYGDASAQTPHLDQLAADGVRYRHAFASTPVCSAARSTLITGMYAVTAGVHNHRSRVRIPQAFQLYPQYLRASGYYCTNNVKTDYNVAQQKDIWDDSSRQAHYQNRRADQPFFAVFNLTTTHESQVAPPAGKHDFRIGPDQIRLPPWHPDTPEIRRDWASYYDRVTLMDAQVGQLLDELKQHGQADNTIVFYYSDHGGALPRGKRSIHDSGTRVPLIVRFPERWSHLAPGQPGSWIDDPVSFVDLPATLLSLCAVDVPAHFQGRAFLGTRKAAPREHVFLFRGRMDERYDTVRAVRDRTYRYVRNYSPHRPCGQHYTYPFEVLPSMGSWYREYVAGRCDPVQSAYWQPRDGEEFYNVTDDPFEVRNQVAAPEYASHAARLRAALRAEILAARDTGFIPEGMAERLADGQTIYEFAVSDRYPLERILDMADWASDRKDQHLPRLLNGLQDPDPIVRYWAATGCLILKDGARSAGTALQARLDDPEEWHDVRVVAAEALAHLGDPAPALRGLQRVLTEGNLYEQLAAQNALDFLQADGVISLPTAVRLLSDRSFEEPANRIPKYLSGLLP